MSFDVAGLKEATVTTIPLYNWEGSKAEWWRQAWKYSGLLQKPFCPRDASAGPFTAGAMDDQTYNETKFTIFVFHTVNSPKLGKTYHPELKTDCDVDGKATLLVKRACITKAFELMWRACSNGCPNVFVVGDFGMNENEIDYHLRHYRE